MNRQEKAAVIESLKESFANNPFFYITDSSALTVEEVNKLRRELFNKGITMRVVKNTLIKKALEDQPEEKGYNVILDALKGPTAIMFTDTANAPARIIKEFRKTHKKPLVKAAYIESDVFLGDEQLEALAELKSKEELVGEIILLLQSPMKNLVSALGSGGSTIMGLLKALEERGE